MKIFRKIRKFVIIGIIFGILGCGIDCTVFVRRPPKPAPIVEVKPPKPHPRAVWIPGHWKWSYKYHKWIWIPGHWEIR